MKPLILLVEDDPQIRRYPAGDAGGRGLSISTRRSQRRRARRRRRPRRPDLILAFSISACPITTGLEVIRGVREWSQMPIVVVSARGQEKDKIAALDLGADDYVAKPFAVGEAAGAHSGCAWRAVGPPPDKEGSGAVFRFGGGGNGSRKTPWSKWTARMCT